MTGAFIHGFLSVNYLGLSYLFSLALGAALWGFRMPNRGICLKTEAYQRPTDSGGDGQ
jgi:hypothetical protein